MSISRNVAVKNICGSSGDGRVDIKLDIEDGQSVSEEIVRDICAADLVEITDATVDVSKDGQDGIPWMEDKETYDSDGVVTPDDSGEVMVDKLYRGLVVPEFEQHDVVDESCTSSEWIMAVDEFGQILLEIPERRADCFDVGNVAGNSETTKQVKELGDLLLESDGTSLESSGSIFDLCNSNLMLKQNMMSLTTDSLTSTDVVSLENSSEASLIADRNCIKSTFKLEEPELLCSIDVDPQKLVSKNNTTAKDYLHMTETTDFHTTSSVSAVKVEPSKLNPRAESFEKFLLVTSINEPVQSFTDHCFSSSSFENMLDRNSPVTANVCQIINVPTIKDSNTRVGVPLELTNSNNDSFNGHSIPTPSTALSVIDLFLENSSFIRSGSNSKADEQVFTTEAPLAVTLTNCLSSESPGVETQLEIGFSDLDQIQIQEPSEAVLASVASITGNGISALSKQTMITKDSLKRKLKPLKTDSKRNPLKVKQPVTSGQPNSISNSKKKKVPTATLR